MRLDFVIQRCWASTASALSRSWRVFFFLDLGLLVHMRFTLCYATYLPYLLLLCKQAKVTLFCAQFSFLFCFLLLVSISAISFMTTFLFRFDLSYATT